MTTYTEVFGSATVPPSDNRYVAISLTANTTFYWPEQATGSSLMADIMEVTPSAAYIMTFPDAKIVSTGRDILVRNIGAYTITLKDNTGGTIGTVAAGEAKYVYLTSNSTTAGVWTIFTFGTGTSAADASNLAGYGLTATGSTLSQSTSTVSSSISTTLAASDRSSLRIFSASGAVTCNLPTAVGLGNGWFACISNQGSGAVTIDPSSTETIDGGLTKDLAPGESTYIVTDGSNWVTVGYGRSTQFQFTKLVYPIAVGTPFTLTSTQAGNKLLEFTGILAAAATVNVPAVVAIYYVECSYTGAYALTIKTAAGTGVSLNAGDRSILYCDGTNVTSAQTASVAVANLSGGVAGAIVYQTGVGATGFSAAGTAGHILVSGGTGTPVFGAAATAPAGLTVSGGTTVTRGLTDNATATALTIDVSGNLGIGVATPSTPLHVYSATLASIFIQGEATSQATIHRNSTDASGPAIVYRKARGTSAAPTAVASGDVLGSLIFNAFAGTNTRSLGGLTARVDTYTSDTAVGSYVQLSTSPNSAAASVENMRIGQDGTTTIGGLSTAPALKVIPYVGTQTQWITVTGDNGNGPRIASVDTAGTSANLYLTTGGATAGSAGSFYVTTGGASNTQVRIDHTISANRYITLTGSNGGNPTIGTNAGDLTITPNLNIGGTVQIGASSVTWWIASGGAASPILYPTGAAADISPYISSKGAGTIYLATQSTSVVQAAVIHTASANRYITLTGSNGGNPTIGTSGGSLALSSQTTCAGQIIARDAYATPAGGGNAAFLMGSSLIGIYFGSGVPTIAAAQGSLYIRTDGGASTRLYSNNNGSTGWSAITSA